MTHIDEKDIRTFAGRYNALAAEIGRLIVGHEAVVHRVVQALVARGHVLIEGLPGLGKTTLVARLAGCMGLGFTRIQFTPDLMPADITGSEILAEDDAGHRAFRFRPGPLFDNLVLADEINRATPKTQSALLEAMGERSVSVGGETHTLPDPFMVLATQNPIELEGTYPLPEAQLDRFMVKLLMRPGGVDQLQAIVRRTTSPELASVNKVCGRDELAAMTQAADRVALPDSLLQTVCRLTMATHPDADEAPDAVRQYVRYGSSPRGAQSVVRLARVAAIAAGRGEVTRDDIEAVAPDALRHRLILNFEGQSRGVDIDEIVREVVEAAVR